MGKTTIRVDCIDQRLFVAEGPVIASGGANEDEIQFDFCSLWDGFEKTAVFYRSETEVYRVLITWDRCSIPNEMLTEEGLMYFGVIGVKDDITRTSEILKYRITKGAILEGVEPGTPTPDIYEQIMSTLAEAIPLMENHEQRLEVLENYEPQPFAFAGNPVQMDNYRGMPMRIVTSLVPGEGAAARTTAALTCCGKNLLPPLTEVTRDGVTVTPQPDGGIRIVGKSTGTAATFFSTPLVGVFTGDYTLTIGNADAIGEHLQLRLMSGAASLMDTNINAANANASRTFTLQGQSVTAWNIRVGAGETYDVTIYPMLEKGSAATAYEPFQGETFAADLGKSIYGGTLDWNAGILTVTHGEDGAQLAETETIQLTPQHIVAVDGCNVLYTDFGEITATGRTDILWLTTGLLDRVAALEAALKNSKTAEE